MDSIPISKQFRPTKTKRLHETRLTDSLACVVTTLVENGGSSKSVVEPGWNEIETETSSA